MYYMTKIEDTVRIPPYRFDDPLEEVAIQTLNDTYNGRLDKKLGLLICVNEIEEIGEGRLIMEMELLTIMLCLMQYSSNLNSKKLLMVK